MSIFIKKSDLKVKNPTTGTYQGQSLFTENDTQTQINRINSAGTTQVNAVNTKGQETLASIPDDYTELSEDVDNLKSAMTNALIKYNYTNLLAFYPAKTATARGVNLTNNGDGSYTLSGTATGGVANFNMFQSGTDLPSLLEAGETYYAKVVNTNVVHLYVYDYSNSTVGTLLYDNLRGDTQFTIPVGCTGLIIRLSVYTNATVNSETIIPIISSFELSDGDLTNLVSTLNQDSIQEKGLARDVFSSCDDAPDNSVYFVSSSNNVTAPEDYPFNFPGWLQTITYSGNIKAQIAIPYYPESGNVLYRIKKPTGWTDWVVLAKNENRTIYVEGNTYNNTYDINTVPTITTDSNGWLQPVDTPSTTEANATDMTGAIMSMLNSTGYCHLAPGLYYVSGNIDLPIGSILEGCGSKTILRLLSTTESGYIAKATRFSSIRGIKFSGGSANPDLSSADIGGRHGVVFIDDATSDGDLPYVRPCTISECWFENFNGAAIYCNDSGGGIQQGLIVSDCYIEFCKVGIDIWYYSEYHKFTNIITFHCYYGCINNAGNNVFIGCTFHGTIGFLIDNASGDLRNPGHGSAVGCTFNHIDNWNRPSTKGGGSAVTINGNAIGFVFTGCQFWYGTVDIEDSAGVLIADSQFGGSNGTPAITVIGEYPTFFNGCIFHAQPVLNVNAASKFDSCYLHMSGEPVTN